MTTETATRAGIEAVNIQSSRRSCFLKEIEVQLYLHQRGCLQTASSISCSVGRMDAEIGPAARIYTRSVEPGIFQSDVGMQPQVSPFGDLKEQVIGSQA